MQFNSAVTKVEFVGAKYLLAASEDTSVQLMDLESGKVKSFTQQGHECSVRNAAVDPKIEICASVGCDGTLIMHKVADCDYISRRKIAEKT